MRDWLDDLPDEVFVEAMASFGKPLLMRVIKILRRWESVNDVLVLAQMTTGALLRRKNLGTKSVQVIDFLLIKAGYPRRQITSEPEHSIQQRINDLAAIRSRC